MRILHVLSERGFSGGEHQLLLVLRHLKTQGHESLFVLNPGARFREHVGGLGLEVHEVAMRNDMHLRAAWHLRRLFRRLSPDLIHLACSRSHKLGAHAGLGLIGVPPRVATRRMDYPLARSPYRRWLYGKAVQAVVAVSDGVREEVLKTGVDPERVHLIPDGVDVAALEQWTGPEARRAARVELGLEESTACGVTTASFHRRKGQDVLLEALRHVRLPASREKFVWIFAGDGPTRGGLEASAAALRDRVEVRFLGQVEHIEPLLAAADVFCLPSRKEGLGVALLEAMAVGRPVVASAIGGIREAVIADQTGLLVPPEDPTALAASLERVISDPALGGALGAAARERVASHFSAEKMCRKTEALYVSLAR